MSENTSEKPDLQMKIDVNVLEHLGLKMYTSLPAVISEYVANAWDAWATNVDIQIPDEKMGEEYEITIIDDGFGMDIEDVNNKFLVVGRNRRHDEDNDIVTHGEQTRPVMGRKGIGKLAGFGVAGVVNVWTCKDGEYVEFELNYDEMQRRAPDDPRVKEDYKPDVVNHGAAEEEGTNGTIITLKNLKRKRRPNPDYVRQRLARRFAVIGDEFEVIINNTQVEVDERNLKEQCQFLREYDESIGDEESLAIEGWIGTLETSVSDEIGNGVVVMARGKLAQEPDTFGVERGGAHGQQALQYLVGEIRADFLDERETDLISTDRSKVIWDEPPAATLRDFLHEEIRDICQEWPKKRRKKHMVAVREKPSYQKYITPLDRYERELADSFLGKLAKNEDYDDETLEDMASYVSSGVQQKSFSHLLNEIDKSDVTDIPLLIELFDKYEVLDALNSLKLIKGRLKAIEKFDKLVETNAREVPVMHDFIGDNPWLLDPQWDYLDDEVTFRQMLEERFPEEELNESNRRIDFVCLGDVNTLKIIEIKRPDKTIGINELDQLKDYVDFARELHGTDPVGSRKVEGYIIGEALADSRKAQSEYKRMEPDNMYIRTYTDLRRLARRSQKEFINVFERKAERTDSQMLQSYIDDFEDADIGTLATQ